MPEETAFCYTSCEKSGLTCDCRVQASAHSRKQPETMEAIMKSLTLIPLILAIYVGGALRQEGTKAPTKATYLVEGMS